MIIALRTDRPEAELALCAEQSVVEHARWTAHRQLAETISTKLDDLLEQHNLKHEDITGVVVYQGPGSFTGLRIGISTANALAYARSVPIVGTTGDDWVKRGLFLLAQGHNDAVVLPKYGAPVHITTQKK